MFKPISQPKLLLGTKDSRRQVLTNYLSDNFDYNFNFSNLD